MAKSAMLPLFSLILVSVLTFACVETAPLTQTPGNSNATAGTAPNSAVPTLNPATPKVPDQVPMTSPVPVPPSSNADTAKQTPTANIQILNTKAVAGREVRLEFELESKEDISVIIFSLDFDPSVFTYVSTSLSPTAPKSAVLTLNDQQTASGKLGALMDSSTAFAKGKKTIMTAIFRVAPNAPARDYQFSFSSTPAIQSVSTTRSDLVTTNFVPGTVRVVAHR